MGRFGFEALGCLERDFLAAPIPKGSKSISRWLSEPASDTTGNVKRTAAPWRGASSAIPAGIVTFDRDYRWCRPAGLNHRLRLWHSFGMRRAVREIGYTQVMQFEKRKAIPVEIV